MESFNQSRFQEAGIQFEVKQINFAHSQKNVFRGLHYQKPPYSQAKLVGVIRGAALDVAVDLRKESPTFLKHACIELSSPETLLLVPRGFAHGYLTLEDDTTFHYAVDNFYAPDYESAVSVFDPSLSIQLPNTNPILSEKDRAIKSLDKMALPF